MNFMYKAYMVAVVAFFCLVNAAIVFSQPPHWELVKDSQGAWVSLNMPTHFDSKSTCNMVARILHMETGTRYGCRFVNAPEVAND